MASTNWKEIVHPGIVEFMAENAKFVKGIPNIAAITRAGIKADESGKYNNPRVFTNEEIQRQVGLLHDGGTPIACIRWYRNNPGPRKVGVRAGFREAYAYFKEQGNSISQEDLAAIAEANLPIIFGARGADLTNLSKYNIMKNFRIAMEEKKQRTTAEKLAKARAARKIDKEKAAEESKNEETSAKAPETKAAPKATKKLKKK